MIRGQVADYGLLFAPRNHVESDGIKDLHIWDLFSEARFCRWCMAELAGADRDMLSRVAIVGYTQEAQLDGGWEYLGRPAVNSIKVKAMEHFRPVRSLLYR